MSNRSAHSTAKLDLLADAGLAAPMQMGVEIHPHRGKPWCAPRTRTDVARHSQRLNTQPVLECLFERNQSYTSRPTVRQVNVRRRARKTVDDASMSLQRRIWTRDEPEHLSAEGPPVPSPSATIRTLERLLRRRWFARGPNAL
jgi:hypothetical protein